MVMIILKTQQPTYLLYFSKLCYETNIFYFFKPDTEKCIVVFTDCPYGDASSTCYEDILQYGAGKVCREKGADCCKMCGNFRDSRYPGKNLLQDC